MQPERALRVGLRGFSPTIDRLIENRIYAPHTVDAVLQDTAIVVTESVVERLAAVPDDVRFRFDELPSRRPLLAAIVDRLDLRGRWHDRLERIARFTAAIERLFPSPEHSAARGYYKTPGDFWWGGTEEQVIAKGSDWCHEVARFYCALAQIAGIPARIVYTLGRDDGHAIAECCVDGAWALVDPLAAHVYRRPDGAPVSIVAMACTPPSLRRDLMHGGRGELYVHERFFELTAVAEYYLTEAGRYDYRLSPCNAIFRALLAPGWNT
jgi:hypothetical protein